MPVLKARVLFSLRLPRSVRLSTDGEGKPGRTTMYGKGGRAARLSVAVRFCRLAFLHIIRAYLQAGLALIRSYSWPASGR